MSSTVIPLELQGDLLAGFKSMNVPVCCAGMDEVGHALIRPGHRRAAQERDFSRRLCRAHTHTLPPPAAALS